MRLLEALLLSRVKRDGRDDAALLPGVLATAAVGFFESDEAHREPGADAALPLERLRFCTENSLNFVGSIFGFGASDIV